MTTDVSNNPVRLLPGLFPKLVGQVALRPSLKISFLGDSITAFTQCGWHREVINHHGVVFGALPTVTFHGVGGITIQGMVNNGQVAAVVADAPDIVFVECGVNDVFDTPVSYQSIFLATTNVLSLLRSGLPNVQIGWVNIWSPYGENIPGPHQSDSETINAAIAAACLQFDAQYIDVTSIRMADSVKSNPSNLDRGGNTADGTHPNWRGRPLMGRAVLSKVAVSGATQPNIDNDPTWLPNADVTPTIWLEADQLSGSGLVGTWGPFSASGAARPLLINNGWQNGKPCVTFDGVQNYMTAATSTPSGAKTIFVVYKMNVLPTVGNNYMSLLTLTNGTVNSEYIPATHSAAMAIVTVNCDSKPSGSDGFFSIGTNDFADAADVNMPIRPVRFGTTFAGGSSTATNQYSINWGGGPMGVVQPGTFLAQTTSCACAIGARLSDGVTPASFCAVDVAAIITYPAQLTTLQFYRVDQYLRRKWGP